MKRIVITGVALILGVSLSPAAEKESMKSNKEKFSYTIGYQMGRDMKGRGVEVDQAALAKGLKDSQGGKAAALSDAEMQAAMAAVQQELQSREAGRKQGQSAENVKEGEAFLAHNKTQPGVKVTASGLQYKEITAGKGKKPTAANTVTVHYRGMLLNGKEFDSSYKRNEPATFPLNGVIPGWTEGLQLMAEGGKAQLVIPSNLAYGPRGAGADIGPDATLVFEVELISVK